MEVLDLGTVLGSCQSDDGIVGPADIRTNKVNRTRINRVKPLTVDIIPRHQIKDMAISSPATLKSIGFEYALDGTRL